MPGELAFEKLAQNARIERLGKVGEARDVGEHDRDLAPLPGKVASRIGVCGEPFREIGREVARQRGAGQHTDFGRIALCLGQPRTGVVILRAAVANPEDVAARLIRLFAKAGGDLSNA